MVFVRAEGVYLYLDSLFIGEFIVIHLRHGSGNGGLCGFPVEAAAGEHRVDARGRFAWFLVPFGSLERFRSQRSCVLQKGFRVKQAQRSLGLVGGDALAAQFERNALPSQLPV